MKFKSCSVPALLALALTLGATEVSAASDLGHSYDPGGRVDPFRPAHGGQGVPAPCTEQRPKIAELEISGVFILAGKRVAQARAGARDYLLREGDRLCDGHLVRVDAEGVVIERLLESPVEMSVASSSLTAEVCTWREGAEQGSHLSCASDLVTLPEAAD